MASKMRSLSPAYMPTRSSLARHVAKKYIRCALLGLVIGIGLVNFLILHRKPSHHAPFEAPVTAPIVHGKKVDLASLDLIPLEPFPYSPQEYTSQDGSSQPPPPNPWLAAVICAASDTEHRMMIRSTWMHLYRDLPFDARFVVSNPGPEWTDVVAMENRTFGDMIVLDHIPEDDVTANTIKTLELYKWLVNGGHRYEFVSKMDTDLWLNARKFWDGFLLPRLHNGTGHPVATVERTVIGELYFSKTWDLVFPHGAMYTMTWDMLELLVSLQERFGVVTGEDMTIAALMLRGRERARFINFRGTEKFDYDERDARGDGTAWARANTHPEAVDHALSGTDVVAVHNLKKKAQWFKVAEAFDEEGLKEAPARTRPDRTPPFALRWFDFWASLGLSRRYKSRFERIPDFLWSLEDGDWICDGIWNLGKRKSGFQENWN